MPLRALDGDRVLLAPLLDDAAWAALREGARLRMACCRSDGYPRTSDRGTRHFVHLRRGDCDWAPESDLHLAAKAELAAACVRAGWAVETEAAGPGWRADVLATSPAARLVFEVQVSPITDSELARRQERYARAGVAGWWLVREPPGPPSAHVPLFCLVDGPALAARAHGPDGEVGAPVPLAARAHGPDGEVGAPVPLAEWCAAVLRGEVALAPRVRAAAVQVVELAFAEARCGSCRAVNHLFAVVAGYRSACGLTVWPGPIGDALDRVAWMRLRPEIGAAVAGLRGGGLSIGPASAVHDRDGRAYLAVGCAMCARPFAHADFRAAARRVAGGGAVARLRVAVRVGADATAAGAHWCAGRERCA